MKAAGKRGKAEKWDDSECHHDRTSASVGGGEKAAHKRYVESSSHCRTTGFLVSSKSMDCATPTGMRSLRSRAAGTTFVGNAAALDGVGRAKA